MLDGYTFDATPVALDEVIRAVHDLCLTEATLSRP